jgi:3D-(3,5/4)-trihydroxycyclohexane-1,2-dione acylhydrolase (decyclizing)
MSVLPKNAPAANIQEMRSRKVTTVRLTTAQAVVRYLQQQFSERDGRRRRFIAAMFGIFGHGNVAGMGQALEECGAGLPYFQPCHEQSMVHTATGYARANSRLATLACTASIGPGSTNMVTGAALATVNRLPVLLFPSDYYATRHQGPVLQQLEHPVSADVSVNDCFRPVSRFFDRITRPEQLLSALPQAMRVLADPAETGAATISLPQDIQAHAWDFPTKFFEPAVWRVERRLPVRERIREAADLIRASRSPMIIAGGGVHYSEAWDELRQFAEQVGIPVGETFAGRGATRTPSEWLVGGLGVTGTPSAGRIAARADLIICVGTRLTDFTTGSQSAFQYPEVRFISINVSPHDAFKMGALPIVADAREALRELLQACQGVRTEACWAASIGKARAEWDRRLREEVLVEFPGEAMSQGQLIRIVNEEAQPGDTIVAAAGSPPGDLHKIWDATGGRTCHLEFGFSCMGYEIPAALGVRLAQPQGEVLVMVGDGTYLMNPSEIVTAVQESLKITVILSENHGYQVIRQLQMARAGRSFGNEFRAREASSGRLEGEYLTIDFAANAESLGARVWKATTPGQVRTALREARAERRPCAIVVETERHRYLPGSDVWWDVAPAEATGDPLTQDLRAQYEKERKNLQKFYC